jgi:hypothetical protein
MPITDLAPWRWGERKVPVRREAECDPFYALQKVIDRLFDDFINSFGLTPFGAFGEALGTFSPRIDLGEGERELIVSAE